MTLRVLSNIYFLLTQPQSSVQLHGILQIKVNNSLNKIAIDSLKKNLLWETIDYRSNIEEIQVVILPLIIEFHKNEHKRICCQIILNRKQEYLKYIQ